jgi:hypothetical protein
MYKVDEERKKQPLRFRNLNCFEKQLMCNGCGGKGGVLNPPELRFTASCNHHDFNYWLGYIEEHRKEADLQFLDSLRVDASGAPWYTRWWHYSAAWKYYLAVRIFGAQFFNYGDRERNWDDLEVDINKKLRGE